MSERVDSGPLKMDRKDAPPLFPVHFQLSTGD
jgi:hypothetical protein